MTYLSPDGIRETYQVGRSTAYNLMKQYEQSGGEVIRIGKLTRVPQDSFESYLKAETEKYKSETRS